MRFRLMATYRGVPYEVGVGPSSSDVVLFAACPPPEELGFEPAPGHWRKHVIRAEVDVLWESRPVGTFHGDPCLVLDDLGDRLHIAYLGKDGRRARELGYWQVNRGVYELLTPRDEVTGLTEEKAEKSLPRRAPVNGAQPMPSYPYGSPQWPQAPAAAGPQDQRGTSGGAGGYVGEPALAPAGAWNGNGTPASHGGLERHRHPRRHRRLEPHRLPRRHWRLEPQRHPGQSCGLERHRDSRGHRRLERQRLPRRHRQLEPQRRRGQRRDMERRGGTAGRGRGERARHGQLERHGRTGWDARRPRRSWPGTQAPGTEARPEVRPQAAGADPGDLLGTG